MAHNDHKTNTSSLKQTKLNGFAKRSLEDSNVSSRDQMVPSEKIRRQSHNKDAPRFDFSNDPLLVSLKKNVPQRDKTKQCASKRDSNRHHASIRDFKTASGREMSAEVHSVTAQKCTQDISNRRLGLSTAFRAPLQTESSAQPKLRTGWKANQTLKHFDEAIIELIESEIMSHHDHTNWEHISGLGKAKKALREIVILPFLRPDIFTGIRAPPKGVLLFGPPGTGKTMIGRCVAAQCKATFFNISASSLTSKWVGEGEKLVRVLFAVARVLQPSIIFIDEIDSLLTSRSEGEHESSRRIKTEFLVNLDGVATDNNERLLVLGATNRPSELDDAAKRRFAKRLYIALPNAEARSHMVHSLLTTQTHNIDHDQLLTIAQLTEGYSGADMKELCAEAAMGPIRDVLDSSSLDITTVDPDQVRHIELNDFEHAVNVVRPTVLSHQLDSYQEWDAKFGSLRL